MVKFNLSDNELALIKKYFNAETSEQEELNIKNKLQTDANFKQEMKRFQAHLVVFGGFEANLAMDLPTPKPKRMGLWIGIVGVCCVALIAGWWVWAGKGNTIKENNNSNKKIKIDTTSTILKDTTLPAKRVESIEIPCLPQHLLQCLLAYQDTDSLRMVGKHPQADKARLERIKAQSTLISRLEKLKNTPLPAQDYAGYIQEILTIQAEIKKQYFGEGTRGNNPNTTPITVQIPEEATAKKQIIEKYCQEITTNTLELQAQKQRTWYALVNNTFN